MISRLLVLCVCLPLYAQEVTTINRIRNTEIVVQIKGFSDSFLRSWKASACTVKQYIQSNSFQFKREFYVLQIFNIFQQLADQGIPVKVEEKEGEFTIFCTHPQTAEQKVKELLYQSPFIFEFDIPDVRPEDPRRRAEYDMLDAGGNGWFKVEGNEVVAVQNNEPDQGLTELWIANTQTQELDPIEDHA